jgi:hypothetical protein
MSLGVRFVHRGLQRMCIVVADIDQFATLFMALDSGEVVLCDASTPNQSESNFSVGGDGRKHRLSLQLRVTVRDQDLLELSDDADRDAPSVSPSQEWQNGGGAL